MGGAALEGPLEHFNRAGSTAYDGDSLACCVFAVFLGEDYQLQIL